MLDKFKLEENLLRGSLGSENEMCSTAATWRNCLKLELQQGGYLDIVLRVEIE